MSPPKRKPPPKPLHNPPPSNRIIETANSLPPHEFQAAYLPQLPLTIPTSTLSTSRPSHPHPLPQGSDSPNPPTLQGSVPPNPSKPSNLPRPPTLHLRTPSIISEPNLSACFDLIALTSASAYRASAVGWSPSKKRREMRLGDLKYLLLTWGTTRTRSPATPAAVEVEVERGVEVEMEVGKRSGEPEGGGSMRARDGDGDGESHPEEEEEKEEIAGFCSFMLTHEDAHSVIYIYEIHLSPQARGQGLGKILMEVVEGVGRQVGVEKAMLTVFVENQAARRFYEEKLGYGLDKYSPRPRKLRSGGLKEVGYVILSKGLR